jgi:hypothetical protein
MEPMLEVRFHFGGKFHTFRDGYVTYLGGNVAESEIVMDKVSYFEIKGHLHDHYATDSALRMFWLKPAEHLDMKNGLVLLADDQSVQVMLQQHCDGGVQVKKVDVYVEDIGVELVADEQEIWAGDDDAGDEQGDEYEDSEAPPNEAQAAVSGDKEGHGSDVEPIEALAASSNSEKISASDKDLRSYFAFYKSPSKPSKGKETDDSSEEFHSSEDDSDSDYEQPVSEDSSAEDEEATEMRKFAYEVKRKNKAKKVGIHGSQVGQVRIEDFVEEAPNLDDPGSPYMDSSDEYSYAENSDGETERWKSLENRYDKKASVPIFSLGMCFKDSRQFKKALVKYGIKTHRHLRFNKDEAKKVRAFCTWAGCKWMIYGSKSTRSEWFKVVTFEDVHTCAPRRDNKLVSSSMIARHYFHEIKDNPTWKPIHIQNRVQRDFLADVSLSQVKRAKSIVLKQALDTMKGEYCRVFDYQMELLRTNPGSTVVVCYDPEIEDRKVFGRFYVCFDAMKKGFAAGYRNVIGLDGCWFKGANNGNLLCAIGRDANNQMYPIAWAAVPIECYDTWYWFLGLLHKDLSISNGGEDWVIISDQQKVCMIYYPFIFLYFHATFELHILTT